MSAAMRRSKQLWQRVTERPRGGGGGGEFGGGLLGGGGGEGMQLRGMCVGEGLEV
jgi:hypothetical protein